MDEAEDSAVSLSDAEDDQASIDSIVNDSQYDVVVPSSEQISRYLFREQLKVHYFV